MLLLILLAMFKHIEVAAAKQLFVTALQNFIGIIFLVAVNSLMHLLTQ